MMLFLFVCLGGVKADDLADGTYKIVSGLNNNKALTAADSSLYNGSSVQISEFLNLDTQKWNVKKLGEGYYSITSILNENKSLDVAGGSNLSGTAIQMYEKNNSLSQQWYLRDAGDGYYYVVSGLGTYMDVSGGSSSDGTKIQTYVGNETASQKFKFVEINDNPQTLADGTYTITSALNDQRALDVSGGSAVSGANVWSYQVNHTWAQNWNVKYLGNGYYSISAYSDETKALDVQNGVGVNCANVWLYVSNGTDAQQWIIRDAGDGYYYIISKLNNLYLDISGGSSNSGANVQIYQGNGTNSQKWKFTYTDPTVLNDGVYTISSSSNSNLVLGIDTTIPNIGSNVSLKSDNDDNTRKWYIKHLGSGVYSIQLAANSNYVLDVQGGSSAYGTNVQVYSSNNTTSQKWIITKNSDGTYSIYSALGNVSLDIKDGNIQENSNIQIYADNKTNAQKFNIVSDEFNESNPVSYEEGYYTISNALDSSKVVDISGGITLNNTNVWLYQYNNTLSQVWYLEPLGDGFYSITSALNRNVSLTVEGGGTASGTNVSIYRNNGSDSQQWYLKDAGDGYLYIVSKGSGYNLDVNGASSQNATNIQIYIGNNSNAQKWQLNEYDGKKVYNGIDVSYYQGDINWEAVARSNVNFAIIRAGYGSDFTDQDDTKLLANIEACEKYNIPYGIYLYSYATDVMASDGKGALSEANHVLRLLNQIKSYGYSPNLGTKVFLDMEGGTYVAGKDKLTVVADTFCSTIENNGYSCGIYANRTWLTNYLDVSYLSSKYSIWLAEYGTNNVRDYNSAKNSKPVYDLTSYDYWQFTSLGNISGINGNVDMDLGYDIFD